MNVTWLELDEFIPTVVGFFESVDTILDIGCGIKPQKYVRPLVHICCEPYIEYVEYLLKKTRSEYDRNYLILSLSWSDVIKTFPPKSVDSVFLVDVIEHIEKEEGIRLLKETERIARRQVAVFTPIGFLPQNHPDGKDAWGLSGANWQEHKSGWQPEDFDVSWGIYACRNFHTTNNKGELLETPFGALWAIKTFEKNNCGISAASNKRGDIHRIVNLVLDINREYVSNTIIFFMDGILRLKKTRAAGRFYRKFLEK